MVLKRSMAALLAVLMLIAAFPVASASAIPLGTTTWDQCNADLVPPASGSLVADYGEDTFQILEDGRVYRTNYFLGTSEPTGIEDALAVLVIEDVLFVAQKDGDGTAICCYDLPDLKGSVMYRIESLVENFAFCDEAIYYLAQGNVYRFSFVTEETSVIYDGGDAISIVMMDDSTLVYNLPDTVDRSDNSEEPATDVSFRYIPSTGETISNFQYELDTAEIQKREFTGHSFTVKVGDVTLPLAEYPDGSYCTTTGGPCYNHNACLRYYTYNGQTVDTLGWQCCGFARYVFWRCFGVVDDEWSFNGYSHVIGSVGGSSISVNYLKSIFGSTVKAGAHIRTGQNGYLHSMAYLGYDSTYVYTYEGNYGNTCGVHTVARTWSEMASYLVSMNGLSYIDMPDSYPASTPSQYTDPLVFNAAYYKEKYSDMASLTDAQAQDHWINYGIGEGRCASPVFDVKWYLDNYTDLKNAFGTDYGSAVIHFINNGVNEGRQASSEFSLSNYKTNYPDIVAALSSNYDIYKHYIDWGRSEKRVANRILYYLPSGVYTLNSKGNTAFNVGMDGNTSGSQTRLSTAAETDRQRFAFLRLPENNYTYLIRNQETGLYLTVGSDGTTVTQTARTAADNQKWHVIENSDGTITLWDFTNKKALDVADGVYADGTSIRCWADNGSNAQRWTTAIYSPLADGVYQILSKKDETFGLDIYNVRSDENTNLTIYTYCGNENQKFAVYRNADGFYTIRALHSNKCLDVTDASAILKANVAQHTENGTAAQQWAVIPNNNGSYTFASRCNGMAMDIDSGSMTNGSNVQCYTCNDTAAQQWVLKPVTTTKVSLEGNLTLTSAIDSSYAADVNDAGSLVINPKGSYISQVFNFIDLNNGYYAVISLATGKTVKMEDGDICLGSVKGGSSASDYDLNEMWQVMPNADGTVGVLSAVNGYYWNARGGKAAANVNIFPYVRNSDDASRWNLEVSSHIHTFTDQVVAPTCTERGYTIHTCTDCGGKVIDTYVDALGHDFEEIGVQPATCQHGEATTYRCKREGCGFEKYEYAESKWSDWGDTVPDGLPESMVESRTVYRYADYETTTSTATSLDGYDQLSFQWQKKSSGSQDRASFPDGFNTSNSLYSQYNKTALSAFENTTKRTIDSTTTVGYIYWHWCAGYQNADDDSLMNRYINSSSSSERSTFHAYFSTSAPSTDVDTSDATYPYCNAKNRSVCSDTKWFFYIPVTRQTYTDYEKLFTYGRFGAWSDWSETKVSATDTRKVETKTEYRYVEEDALAPHDYVATVGKAPTCTEPGYTESVVCSVCGDVKTASQPIAALGHDMTTEHEDASCIAPAATRHYCTRCDYWYREFDELKWGEWSDTKPDADPSLIKSRTVYRYADYETTTSTATSLEGYDQLSFQWQKKSSGSQDRASFPAGFSTSNSLYSQYNKTALSAFENTTKRTIDSTATVGYIYWHWCAGYQNADDDGLMNRYIDSSSSSERGTFHAYFSTSAPSTDVDTSDATYPYCNAKNRSVCSDTKWFFYIPVTRQTYTDYEKLFTYGRFGAWSDWSETQYTASETRKVESKTQYAQASADSFGPHQFALINAVEATCTKEGYTGDSVCSLCGTVESKGQTIPMKDHTAQRTGEREATCTEEGYTGDLVCSVCKTTLEKGTAIKAKGHTRVTGNAKEATCLNQGYTGDVVCSVCHETLEKGTNTPALGHDWKKQSTVAPTCTEEGYSVYVCTRCGLDDMQDIVAPIAHDFEEATSGEYYKAPTCEESGYTFNVCKVCGAVGEGRDIPATGHTIVVDKAVPATCTTDGKTAGTHCSTCGKILSAQKTVPATGHTLVTQNAKDATCTAQGYSGDKVCSVCHTTVEYGKVTAALGHNYQKQSTVAPTCTEEGYSVYVCSRCKAEEMRDIVDATGHTLVTQNAKDATCTAQGYTGDKVCSVCHTTVEYGKVTAALGHDYQKQSTVAPTCTEEGYSVYVCSRCKDEDMRDIVDALGHTEGTPVDNGDGTHTVSCTICQTEIRTEAHTYVDGTCACGAKEAASEPTYDASLKFLSKSFTMGSSLNMVFIASKGTDTTRTIRAEVTKYNADGTTTVRTYTVADGNMNDQTRFVTFTFDGVAAKEMGDKVEAKLFATDASGNEFYGETLTLSLKDFLMNYAQSSNEAQKNLAVALLNYGAAAQVYFDYNYDGDATKLVNNDLTEDQKVIDIREASATTVVSGDGCKCLTNSVLLESKIVLYAIFNLGSYASRIDELAAVVTNAATGEEVTRLNLTKGNGTLASFRFDDVSAKNTRTVFNIAIYDGDTKISQDLQWSMECMVSSYRAASNTPAEKLNLANAMLAYGDYAAAYLE